MRSASILLRLVASVALLSTGAAAWGQRSGEALVPLGQIADDTVRGQPADVLTLQRVLQSSARSAPEILAAMARERQADGRLFATNGEFDLMFGGNGFSRVLGYYDGSQAEARAYQPLSTNGGQLFAGYRVSRGDFPIYEDQYFTNKLGEVKVGGVFSLVRDRLTDTRRTARKLVRNDVEIAGLERRMVAIGVQQRAIDAYLTWVSAGQRLGVYRALLGLATSLASSGRSRWAVSPRSSRSRTGRTWFNGKFWSCRRSACPMSRRTTSPSFCATATAARSCPIPSSCPPISRSSPTRCPASVASTGSRAPTSPRSWSASTTRAPSGCSPPTTCARGLISTARCRRIWALRASADPAAPRSRPRSD